MRQVPPGASAKRASHGRAVGCFGTGPCLKAAPWFPAATSDQGSVPEGRAQLERNAMRGSLEPSLSNAIAIGALRQNRSKRPWQEIEAALPTAAKVTGGFGRQKQRSSQMIIAGQSYFHIHTVNFPGARSEVSGRSGSRPPAGECYSFWLGVARLRVAQRAEISFLNRTVASNLPLPGEDNGSLSARN
jgi:hypothetical protein